MELHMATTDVYRFVGNASFATNMYQVTLAFQSNLPGNPLPADIATVAEDVKTIFRAYQVSTVAWLNWDFTQLWGPSMVVNAPKCTRSGGLAFAGNFLGLTTGGVTGEQALPPQCAVVTTLLSNFAGRRKRGRNYMFGLAESAQLNGILESGFNSNVQNAWNTFFTKYGPAAATPVFKIGIWSEREATGCVPNESGDGHVQVDVPNPAGAFTLASAATVRSVVYTQRRRTLG